MGAREGVPLTLGIVVKRIVEGVFGAVSPSNARSHPAVLAPPEVLRLPHRAESVRIARRTLRESMVRMNLPDEFSDDAEVVISELLGNAVRHARAIAGGVVVMGWQLRNARLHLRVTDGGSGRTVEARKASLTAVSGRGLHIVERLADEWGVTNHAGGLRTVWASLPLDRVPSLRLVR